MKELFIDVISKFKTDGEPRSCSPFGGGHINKTYLAYDSAGSSYILQNINTYVFKQPEPLMTNVLAVTEHLGKYADHPKAALQFVPALSGGFLSNDDNGGCWRMYRYIDGYTREETNTEIMRECGAAFGRFQRCMLDFPAEALFETIPRFHDTPFRYEAFHTAVDADTEGRARNVRREIDFAFEREDFASLLMSLQASGELPVRVTHNDTKVNNVIFDNDTNKALCIIDLDTVMPGLSVNDFGDSIRFGASTAAEDETDLDKVQFSLPLYKAYTEGFLSECRDHLTEHEKEHLITGAKMMTLECGVRFLTDYLSGDVYFGTSREGQNLDRCRTQFKLLSEMERQENDLRAIIKGL